MLTFCLSLSFVRAEKKKKKNAASSSPKELIPPERQGRTFVAGEHSFPFVFNITPSAAPAERCNYGRVSQRVQAVGKGLGRANSDISSCFRYLAFVANPKPDVGDCEHSLFSL